MNGEEKMKDRRKGKYIILLAFLLLLCGCGRGKELETGGSYLLPGYGRDTACGGAV